MKLFEIANFSGEIISRAAQKAVENSIIDADRSMLLNANKSSLRRELNRTYKSLVAIANNGNSIPAKEHDYLVGRKEFIQFLLNPSRNTCTSLQWMWTND